MSERDDSPVICENCDRPIPTEEQWKFGACGGDTTGDGCECEKCQAVCWGGCKPHDWRAEALQLRSEVERLRKEAERG